MPRKFTNRASSTLTHTITNTGTTLVVAVADADRFPVVTVVGDYFLLVLQNATQFEIVKVTGRAFGSPNLTGVVRGFEGTVAIGWVATTNIGLRVTADTLAGFDTMAATLDAHLVHPHPASAVILHATGSGSAYSILPTPALTSYAPGASFFVKFPVPSEANATLTISNLGAQPALVKQLADGTYANLAAGDIGQNHFSNVTLLGGGQVLVETIRAGVVSAARTGAVFSGPVLAPTAAVDTDTTQLATTAYAFAAFKRIYPIGCIFASTVGTNPGAAAMFGFGTWVQFAAGRMLMGNGGAFGIGATGGSNDAG